ncbi:hypothetical protein D3C77_396860 [compost metagenome]
MQAGQLTVLVQLDLQYLAAFELAELLGLLVARQYFMHRGGGQAYFGEQGRQGVAAADCDFAVARVLGRGSFRCGSWRRCRLDLGSLLRRRSAIFDLGEWGGLTSAGALGQRCFRLLLELLGRALQFQVKGGLLGFYFAGGEHQQGQAEQGGDAAGGQQMALRIKRGRFRRFVGHR